MIRNDLDLIIPVLNPPPEWATRVIDLIAALQKKFDVVGTILVDDGTLGGISGAVRHLETTLERTTHIELERNHGKGHALRQGLAVSTAPLAVFTDCDVPYTTDSTIRVCEAIGQYTDIAIASRPPVERRKAPLLRRFLSRGLTAATRIMFNMAIDDSQAGLKAMNSHGRTAFLETESDHFLADLEFLILAQKKSLRVAKVEVELRSNIGYSKMNHTTMGRELAALPRLWCTRWRKGA